MLVPLVAVAVTRRLSIAGGGENVLCPRRAQTGFMAAEGRPLPQFFAVSDPYAAPMSQPPPPLLLLLLLLLSEPVRSLT